MPADRITRSRLANVDVEAASSWRPDEARGTRNGAAGAVTPTAIVSSVGEFDHIVAAMQASPVTGELMAMTAAEDFSRLDANAAKRHHFLPQFWLRGFAHSHHGKDCTFQMDTTRRAAPQRVDVRTAASRRHLYTAKTADGRSNRLEGYLALVESHAAPALHRLLDGPGSLTPGDRATIAYLIALQTMRTPSAASQITRIANNALKTAAGEFFSDSQAVAHLYRERFDASANMGTIERFREQVLAQVRAGEISLNGSDGASFATAFQHAIGNVPVLIACHWTLLRSPGGGLITSDRGYAIHDPTPPYPWAAQGLLSSERVEVTVPLSDGDCLLIRPGFADAALDVRQLPGAERELVNLRTFGWARTYVFGRPQETLQVVRLAARRHPARVIRPKPFCFVSLIELDPDDTSLAHEHQRRGWPAYLRNEAGVVRDYIVIPDDGPHPELWQLADELAERRARKRAGVDMTESVPGRIVNRTLHPLELSA